MTGELSGDLTLEPYIATDPTDYYQDVGEPLEGNPADYYEDLGEPLEGTPAEYYGEDFPTKDDISTYVSPIVNNNDNYVDEPVDTNFGGDVYGDVDANTDLNNYGEPIADYGLPEDYSNPEDYEVPDRNNIPDFAPVEDSQIPDYS